MVIFKVLCRTATYALGTITHPDFPSNVVGEVAIQAGCEVIGREVLVPCARPKRIDSTTSASLRKYQPVPRLPFTHNAIPSVFKSMSMIRDGLKEKFFFAEENITRLLVIHSVPSADPSPRGTVFPMNASMPPSQ